jgi:hypothetical protein
MFADEDDTKEYPVYNAEPVGHPEAVVHTPNAVTTKPKITKISGLKFDQDKIDWSLLPIEPTEEMIKVLMFGTKKYSRDNWKHVEDHKRRYYNAALRHLTAWQKGEQNDLETGFNHLAHALCCITFLLGREEDKNVKKAEK